MNYTAGRNLYSLSKGVDGFIASNGKSISTMNATNREHTSGFIPVTGMGTVTLRTWVPSGASAQGWLGYAFYTGEDMSTVVGSRPSKYGDAGTTIAYTAIAVPATANFMRVSFRRLSASAADAATVKAEFGSTATDWRPAPEDADGSFQYNVLTRASLTLTHVRDVDSVTRYYKLQASTASAPSKPTTATPSGWVTTEPSYTEGSTNSLYIVDKTTLSDGTFSYSAVSLSSSYEAAKAAYNKSVAAQQAAEAAQGTANTVQENLDNLSIGGRNYLRVSPKSYTPGNYNAYDLVLTEPLIAGQSYTLQLWDVDVSHTGKTAAQTGINIYYCGGSVTFGGWTGTNHFTDGHADHLSFTFTPTEANVGHSNVTSAAIKFIRLYNSVPAADGTRFMSIGKWKLEKGNRGSDWTPAPEDGGAAIDSRLYTGLIGSANTAADASFYFAKVHPTNYTVQWMASLRIFVTSPEAYMQTVDISLGGYGSTFASYNAYTVRNSALGFYYVNLYRATQAGINTNRKGHALGIGLRNATNPANASYPRTVRVEVMGAENCTVEMLDSAVLYADLDGTGSTNYSGLTELSVATNGQNATNNTNTHYQQHGSAVKAGENGVRTYSLIMKDTDSTWSSFFGSAYNGTATGKTVCETGFLLGPILYSAGAPSGGNYAAGANTSTVYDGYPVDFRYSSNCATTLTAYKPVYIVGEMHDDGKLYLDSTWWTQTVPDAEDGKTYVYVGDAYSAYQVWLSVENRAYQFYDGAFITYEEAQDARARAAAENARTYAESLISQKADEIEISISTVTGVLATDIQDVRDTAAGAAAAVAGGVQELEQRVSDQEDALLDYRHETSTYFRFNEDGLNIGKQEDGDESPYSINIDNEKMAFMQNGQEIAYVQYNKMHINAIEAMDRLSVGAAADGGYFDFISTEYGMGIKWRAVASSG